MTNNADKKRNPPAATKRASSVFQSAGVNPPTPEKLPEKPDIVKFASIRLNGRGMRVHLNNPRFFISPPDGRGKVKGWSASSRRRFRDTLLLNTAPDGWQAYSLTLTVPALPVGSPSPCISRDDALKLWHDFSRRLSDAGHLAIWRLEIQSRLKTYRDDIRGIPQPHWHVIGACPPDYKAMYWVQDTWLRLLGDRGKVDGAKSYAVDAEWCSSWSDGQLRYLYDHASKSKAEQIADGWGRHWGVIGRKHLVKDQGEIYRLSYRQTVELWRLVRRLHRRRVPDPRGRGGVNWANMTLHPCHGGTDVKWFGGSWLFQGISPAELMQRSNRLEAERRITRLQGLNRGNVWALRGGRNMRGIAGQWFGAAGVGACLQWVLDNYPTSSPIGGLSENNTGREI